MYLDTEQTKKPSKVSTTKSSCTDLKGRTLAHWQGDDSLHEAVSGQMLATGHRPVIVKWAVIGSKGGWISAQYLSCKVFHDWSINIWYLLDWYIFVVLFDTTYHCFC